MPVAASPISGGNFKRVSHLLFCISGPIALTPASKPLTAALGGKVGPPEVGITFAASPTPSICFPIPPPPPPLALGVALGGSSLMPEPLPQMHTTGGSMTIPIRGTISAVLG